MVGGVTGGVEQKTQIEKEKGWEYIYIYISIPKKKKNKKKKKKQKDEKWPCHSAMSRGGSCTW
jgi:hypothetical protein